MRNEYGLTEKEEAFCHEYVANDGNAILAARRAGYVDDKSNMIRIVAGMNLTDAKIIRRIKMIREDVAHDGKVSVEWTITHLMEIVSRCMQEEGGADVSEYKFNPQGAIKALMEIIKIMGWNDEDFKAAPKYASEEDIRKRMGELIGRALDRELGEESSKFSSEEKAVLVDTIITSRYEAEDKVMAEIIQKAILDKNNDITKQ